MRITTMVLCSLLCGPLASAEKQQLSPEESRVVSEIHRQIAELRKGSSPPEEVAWEIHILSEKLPHAKRKEAELDYHNATLNLATAEGLLMRATELMDTLAPNPDAKAKQPKPPRISDHERYQIQQIIEYGFHSAMPYHLEQARRRLQHQPNAEHTKKRKALQRKFTNLERAIGSAPHIRNHLRGYRLQRDHKAEGG